MKAPTDGRLRASPARTQPARSLGRTRAPDTATALRMRDLVRESGLPRETIHFYMQQGLLPQGPEDRSQHRPLHPDHLERLRRIRELQERQFLPLKAIRAILDDTADEGFTPEQEDLVRRVRATLGGWVNAQQSPTVAGLGLRAGSRAATGTEGTDRVRPRAGARPRPTPRTLSEDDAVILECWAQFKEAGLSPDRGVGPAEFELYDSAMEQLVRREARLALRAYSGATVDELSRVVEQTGPIIGRLLSAMHRKRLRQFLAEAGEGS